MRQLLKQVAIAFALSFVVVFVALSAKAQQGPVGGTIPGCPTPAQFIADAKKLLAPQKVEARIFTVAELKKLAGPAAAETLQHDTSAIVFIENEQQALVLLGSDGKVCEFWLVDADEARKFIARTLGDRNASQ